MKIFTLILTCLTLLMAAPAWAEHEEHDHDGKVIEEASTPTEDTTCKDTIKVTVHGMVCDFCARALEKVFGKQKEVAGIAVDLDNSQVVVAMKPGKVMDDILLTQLITDSGYNVAGIEKGC